MTWAETIALQTAHKSLVPAVPCAYAERADMTATRIPKDQPIAAAKRPETRFKVYTVERAKAQFDRLLADVEAGCVIDITRRGRAVASILSNAKLETLEIMANPEAMRVLNAFKAKKIKARRLKMKE